jgi:hypothetical protein
MTCPPPTKAPRPEGPFFMCAPIGPLPFGEGGAGAGGGASPPAYWPYGSPGRPRCRWAAMPGGQARMSGTPPSRRSYTVQPFALDGLPGRPARRPPVVAGGGTRLRRVLLRWQAPQPYPLTGRRPHPAQLPGLDPYVNRYVNPYGIPYALGVRTPGVGCRGCLSSSVPFGGVERACRKERFARLTHAARPRSWRTCGPRRLRRQSQAGLVATQGGTA